MKIKNGFTLIELLAVIVILAIIAIIATPIVLNIISDVRKNSTEISMENIDKAASLYFQRNYNDENIVFECSDGKCKYNNKKLELSGKSPESGKILIDKKGNITYEDIVINGFNCYKEHEKFVCDTKKIRKIYNENKIVINSESEYNLFDYNIYGNSVQVKLPSEYQQVEYIRNEIGSYIDTDIYPDLNTKVELDIQIERYSTNKENFNFIFGTRELTTNVLGRFELLLNSENHLVFNLGRVIDYRTIYDVTQDYKRHLYIADATTKKLTMDNDIVLSDMGEESCADWVTSTKPLILFNQNFSIDSSLSTNVKIYNAKIYQSNVLVRNYIPCYRKSDNVIGLYDLVENKFYTNNETGTFLKGNNAPIEIKSVGDYDETTEKYKIPVKVNGDITNIYLDEPLRKVGDKADYIDFKNQKVVRYIEEDNLGNLKILSVSKEEEIELPEILLNKGISNIEIMTSVKPSKVELEYYK